VTTSIKQQYSTGRCQLLRNENQGKVCAASSRCMALTVPHVQACTCNTRGHAHRLSSHVPKNSVATHVCSAHAGSSTPPVVCSSNSNNSTLRRKRTQRKNTRTNGTDGTTHAVSLHALPQRKHQHSSLLCCGDTAGCTQVSTVHKSTPHTLNAPQHSHLATCTKNSDSSPRPAHSNPQHALYVVCMLSRRTVCTVLSSHYDSTVACEGVLSTGNS
jgi:hypothetical protein